MLSYACHAFSRLLSPIEWEGVFIPVLPPSLLPFIDAPTPFIIGCHSSILGEVNFAALTDVVFCDLDSGSMLGGRELPLLPANMEEDIISEV